MKRFLLLPVFMVFFASALSALADGLIIINKEFWPVRPPEFPSRPIRPYAPLEITYHHVNVKIDGQIATTSVDQDFYNPNPQRLEGTYLFPIPKGAQIDKFTMEIGGQQVEAELLAADKARGIYEDIVRKLKDPALLEYAGRDVFKVRVFPIEPNGHKRITLSYTQVLPSDAGLVSYVYPLNTEKFSAKPIQNVSVKVELDSKRSLKTIYSPSHSVEIKRDGPRKATIGYEASNVTPDTDFALYFAPEQDDVGLNLLTYKKPGEDGYFLLLASPGMDAKEKQVVLKDVVFVLDTSGSMSGKKIKQARKALEFCVDNLNDGDRFELVRFSTEVEPLFDNLVEASPANRSKAEDFIKDLRANGATAIDDALRKALSLRPADSARPFVIIFLTDGMPTVGVTDEYQILANVKQNDPGHTRIFCFGIGTDVNTHLLDKLTELSRGYSQYVMPDEDLEVKVSSFFAKIKEPVLANPTLKFTGDVRATKMYPSSLPDLFKGEQLVLAGRYSGKGGSAVTIEGTVNGTSKKFAYDLNFPEESSDHEFIPRLWATRRVGYLLDEIRLHGENAELRDEVTDLARKYGIVTPYTAYLIVEDEDRRGVASNMRSMQGLDKDFTVRDEAKKSWSRLNQGLDGSRAVGGAQFNGSLKSAMIAPASPSVAAAPENVYAMRSLGLSTTHSAAGELPEVKNRERLVEYSQQTRFVNGRNFFQNGNQWLDSEVQKQRSARHTRIQFNSPEYFAFAAKNSQALPWLALGQNVQFLLDGIVYEIYE
jgi:Ca-activated chloride channel family protein